MKSIMERTDPVYGTTFCTRTIANVFDWNLIHAYDPKLLEMQADADGMSKIMSAISAALVTFAWSWREKRGYDRGVITPAPCYHGLVGMSP